jgi:hypothetical protein
MKIGLVIHGPEVIDSGEAKRVFEKLSCLGIVEARLGGTMGRMAVLDARLENVIDTGLHLKPSACIESFFEVSDLVFLLNRGKTVETGRIFGEMVAARLREPEIKPLIQIESPESADGKLVALNKKAGEYSGKISEALGLPAEIPSYFQDSTSLDSVFHDSVFHDSVFHDSVFENLISQDLTSKNSIFQGSVLQDSVLQDSVLQDSVLQDSVLQDSVLQDSVLQNSVLQNSVFVETCPKTNKTRVIRKLSGVFSGENILINGIVIGKALSSEINIVSENGFIVAIEGGEIKEHGLEKLHNYEKRDPVDLAKAWVKSGNLRRSNFCALQAKKRSFSALYPDLPPGPGTGKVVLIDHAAEYTFELAAGAELAVTVGDDTTAIAGDILSRLGIPIIGITDGDCDRLTCQTAVFPGSVVLRLAAGNDDILGKKLKHELFRGENSTYLDEISSFKEAVMKLAEPLIESIFEY